MNTKLLNVDFSKYKVLVVGDVMIDEYAYGNISRISPEYPVPVFEYKRNEYRLGGSANVAKNLTSIGFNVDIMGAVGQDDNANLFISLCQESGFGCDKVVTLSKVKTTVKTRYLNQNNNQILRVDNETKYSLPDDIAQKLLADFESYVSKYDAVFISDYLKGFLTFDFTKKLISIANSKKVKTFVDVKDPVAEKYSDCYLLKPNKNELKLLSGMPVDTDEQTEAAARRLKERTNSRNVVVTLGAKGMLLLDEKGEFYRLPTVAKEVFDVTGAGDTVLSYLGAMNVIGFDVKDSMELANIAAGIKVGFHGTTPVGIDMVIDELDENKIEKAVTLDQFMQIKANLKGKKIVFTNGCFDILHAGHIESLKRAKAFGDVLVVGLNSDDSIKRLKGPSRPINSLQDRIKVLGELACVDFIIPFEDDTPYTLIATILPDFLVKGGDYKPEDIVGYKEVTENGGKVVVTAYVDNKSTTGIIEKMKKG